LPVVRAGDPADVTELSCSVGRTYRHRDFAAEGIEARVTADYVPRAPAARSLFADDRADMRRLVSTGNFCRQGPVEPDARPDECGPGGEYGGASFYEAIEEPGGFAFTWEVLDGRRVLTVVLSMEPKLPASTPADDPDLAATNVPRIQQAAAALTAGLLRRLPRQ
jgi:hypothetical protein